MWLVIYTILDSMIYATPGTLQWLPVFSKKSFSAAWTVCLVRTERGDRFKDEVVQCV